MGGLTVLRRRLMDRGGFTLLETMVALGILAFGLLAVVGLFVAAVGGTAQGGRMTEAVSLAQQKMEDFKTIPYPKIEDITVNPADVAANTNIGPSGQADDPHKFYTRTWTVTENAALQLKTITVNVKWTSKGKDHVITLSTKRAYDR